jgi:hypothetical protein
MLLAVQLGLELAELVVTSLIVVEKLLLMLLLQHEIRLRRELFKLEQLKAVTTSADGGGSVSAHPQTGADP